jgi:hypothetical protein
MIDIADKVLSWLIKLTNCSLGVKQQLLTLNKNVVVILIAKGCFYFNITKLAKNVHKWSIKSKIFPYKRYKLEMNEWRDTLQYETIVL